MKYYIDSNKFMNLIDIVKIDYKRYLGRASLAHAKSK